ncbi:hypothetical protein [Agrobacterium sp. NPDC090273]|uniref:hypothetical protein n=1 Tax=Agrobacterium sp. NPDC090273 TaxID=3363919 RepID=UPI00383A37F7
MNHPSEQPEANSKRRPIWPWLLLGALTLGAIYVYWDVMEMIEDTVRLWNDLVQLFWLIIPDRPE